MKKYLCLTLMIIIAGCKCPFIHMVELGNNFALVQVDDTDILYDRKGKRSVTSVRKVLRWFQVKSLPITMMSGGLSLNLEH